MSIKQDSYELSRGDGHDAGVALLDPRPESLGKDEKETKEKKGAQMVGFLELFQYADKWDKLLMFIGVIGAVAHGLCFPTWLILFGKSFDVFVVSGSLEHFLSTIDSYLETNNLADLEILKNPSILNKDHCGNISKFYGGNITCAFSTNEGVYEEMKYNGRNFFLLTCAVVIFGYFELSFWTMTGERQAKRIRGACLHNVLHQSIGWFDMHKASELNTRLADDIAQIQDGLGGNIGALFRLATTSLADIVLGFFYGWKLSLVIFACCPLMMFTAIALNKLQAALTAKELMEYAKAGGIAEEVFGAMRTVVAFGGQAKEATRYFVKLSSAGRYGAKKAIVHGVTLATIHWFVVHCYALGFWYGGKLCQDEPDNYAPDNVSIVLIGLLYVGFAVSNAIPSLQSLAKARGAAYAVFNLVQLKSPIDASNDKGKRPTGLKGVIQLSNVHFSYPARPHLKVLNDVNVEIHPGQMVALVGASGCGKSTIVQLLLRFYDPDHGQILLDGQDIRDLNIKWLRQHIGLVSQEPVLFATTIVENIRYGRDGVTMDEIISAAKNANAYDFIMQLPQQFETFVGESGAQLSGGQKQRIAIARALIRDPKILLLDEATSALDTESESVVQDALDEACHGRTTIIIAHRLSTIKNADVIIGCHNGQFVEKGTHENLMDHKGIYYRLVTEQAMSQEKGDNVKDGDIVDDKDDKDDDDFLEKKDVDLKSKKGLIQIDSTSELDKKIEDDDDAKDLPRAPFLRLLKMNLPEWYFIVLGCIGSLVSGLSFPIFSLLFSDMLASFSEEGESERDDLALKMVALGFINLIVFFLQATMFGLSGEALTLRLRDLTFKAILKQDIAWFDDQRNSVGALTTRLSTDASQVHGGTGIKVGVMLMSFSTMVATLVIAFTFGWKMTLVLIGLFPLMTVGDVIRMKMNAGQTEQTKEALEGAGKVTGESIRNIRTITSLSREQTFYSMYMENLEAVYKLAMRNAHIAGIAFSFSQASFYLFYGIAFVFGAYMINEGEMSTSDVFRTTFAVMFGSVSLGSVSVFAPDLGKAEISAKRILHLLDSEPLIDHSSSEGKKLTNDYTGNLSFCDVNFHYPTRQTVPVLQDMSFSVAPGQTVALVGGSGCGKSTTVSLVERFYDTVSGIVCLDDNDIKILNVEWLRSQMALVSQEPALFDQTIAENIAFGDNSRVVSIDEIVVAARTANIHNFITSLPDGYDTNVGAQGTQLSGGQKQRIAIARALVRNPKILLLDEATSALDTESEAVVQEALDKASEGRTCVVIAHRLSTIQNADKICVVRDGRVSEQGTHSELTAMKGFYHKLVKKSMKTV